MAFRSITCGNRPAFAAIVSAAVLLGSAAAWACNVPVFRFALERWRPDPYRAVLFHRGPLSEADREILTPLEKLQEESHANLALQTIDVTALDESVEEDAADLALFAELGEPTDTTLALQYPAHLKIDKPVWAGAPEREAIAALVDSPLRQELVRRLAAGETAVWLLLECGDAERDEAAAALLTAELEKLQEELELPELTAAPEDALLADVPMDVSFSLLRVPRAEPAEEALVAMLVGSESDLAERNDPMVFSVFGRGRALLPLVGAGITAENVHDSAAFLVGACSCEVKELNPGFDLLLTADWDALLTAGGEPLPAAPTLTSVESAEAELVPIPTGAQSRAAQTNSANVVQRAGPVKVASIRIVHPISVAVIGVIALGAVSVLLVTGIIAAVRTSHADPDS
jgi:hypothetical protein